MHRRAEEQFDRAIGPALAWALVVFVIVAAVAVFAIAACPKPAHARTLIVKAQNYQSASGSSAEIEATILEIMKGHTFDVKPWTVVDTTVYISGYLRDTVTRSGVQYDAIVIAGAWKGFASSALYDPFACTRNDRWSYVPIAYIGITGHQSNDQWQDGASAASDSVGSGNNLGVAPTNGNFRFYDPRTWKSWNSSSIGFVQLGPAANLNPLHVWRPLVKVGASVCRSGCDGAAESRWRDQVAAPTAAVDTVAMWAKYGRSTNPSGRRKPVVFLHCSGGVSGNSPALIKAALAFIDSVSGHQVFDNTALVPERFFVALGPIFSSSKYTSAAYSQTGVFCAADSCDSANVRSAIDSLRATGKRVTVLAQMDSLGSQTWQKSYFGLLGGNAKYVASDWSGGEASRASGNASNHRIVDPLGVSRTRTLLKPNSTGLYYAITSTDTSLWAMLVRQKAKRDSLWPADRRDNTLITPLGSTVWGWARSVTRSNGRTLDSLAWLIYMAGYRAIAVDPLDAATPNGAGPFGNPAKKGFLTVYDAPGSSSAKVIGRLPLVPVRWYEESGSLFMTYTAHDYVGEFQRGRYIDPWYQSAFAFATGSGTSHDFMSRLYGIVVPTNGLGGAGQGTVPRWPAWHELRRLSIETDIQNQFGRTLTEWAWPEDVARGIR